MLNEGNIAGVSPEGRFSFIYNSLGFKPTSLEIPNETHGGGKQGKKGKDEKMRRKLQKNKKVEVIIYFLLALKVLTK